jgi:NADH dehydrogenase (ubiquinone) Fe-S protein 3
VKKFNNFLFFKHRNLTFYVFYFQNFYLNIYFYGVVLTKYIYLLLIDLFEIEILTSREFFFKLVYYLKYSLFSLMNQLIDIIVIDIPGKKLRFKIIYLFMSIQYNTRYKISIYTNELIPLSSLTKLYSFANWPEREIWDLFGILIMDHPDLRRLLTDYGFSSFPLRKDYPLSGYFELYYDDNKKKILKTPVSLIQEYRVFTFKNPWHTLKT